MRARRRALSEVLARELGLDVTRFPSPVVDQLLARLPGVITADDPSVLAAIKVACSVGETSFLRHREHFHALRAVASQLPSSLRGEPVRAWSAGCASGEEAFSLAAELSEATGRPAKVLGTDMNPQLLARARSGRFALWSLRGLESSTLPGWLGVRGGAVEVSDDVRRLVTFAEHNLARDPLPSPMDVVFLRNVLIYFLPEAAARVLSSLAEVIAPGGVLVVGYFDPRVEAAGLWERQELGEATLFRRREQPAATASAPVAALAASEPAARPELAGDDPSSSGGDEAAAGGDQAGAADEAAGEAADEAIEQARRLFSQGAWREALVELDAAAERAPLDARVHVLAAMIADEAGLSARALVAARRAHFLSPCDPVALYVYGVCLEAVGEPRRARWHLEQASAALGARGGRPGDALEGDVITVSELRRMIDVRIRSGRG